MRLRYGSFESATPAQPGAPDQGFQGRVSGSAGVLKGLGALGFALVSVGFVNRPAGTAFGLVVAVLLAGYAARDLLVPVRVEADAEGVTVATGFAGRRRLPWSAVERVRVDERSRLGTRSRLLEIDTGESLYLFGRAELGGPVEVAAERLVALHTMATAGPGPDGDS